MLSIIVCSQKPDLYLQLKNNVELTIGNIKYEILRIENSKTNYSIAEAYNLGIKKSNFPILLFIHEDILFHTWNWGSILTKYFEDSNIGIIGIAGSKVKTATPTGWWENEPDNWVMNLIQQYPDGRRESITRGFKDSKLEETVVVDGVFIAMRKDPKINFDERLKGFHNYDQSISTLYRINHFKLFVTKEILIEHFSTGKKDNLWLESNITFYNFYKHHLPQSVTEKMISKKEIAYSYLRLINNFKNNNKNLALQYWFKYFLKQPDLKKTLRLLRTILK